ncbi:hypothetical protein [Cryptosporangium japonicum]|uniref:Uncharacterized protein n=1 Tax=Cryptosporangium japonicum TaxID=80872 RepID=A0ABN0UQD9_9ACTN
MRRAERLDAPRVWLPRGGRRGWVRAACVVTLVVAAGAILLLPYADVGQGGISAEPEAGRSAGPGADRSAGPGPERSAEPGAEGSAGPGGASAVAGGGGPAAREAGAPGSGSLPACRSGEFAPPRGAVGFPLRLPDPAVLAVLHAGQHVDVLVPSGGATAAVVAADLPVLCGDGTSGEPDGVLYLAASAAQATALAAIGPGARPSVTVRSPR